MASERAICVVVDDSRKIMQGLSADTTAEDVISSLKVRCGKSSPQVLVELWNGCSRTLPRHERVCTLLDHWGNQASNVHLVMMDTTTCRPSKETARTAQLRNRWKQTHGKVSYKKRRSSRYKSQRALGIEIDRLIETVQSKRDQVQSLVTPPEFRLKDSRDNDDSPIMFGHSGGELSPDQEEEYTALQEESTEEHREHSDLLRRHGELLERKAHQEREIESLKRSITTMESKILLEERQLPKLVETGAHPDFHGRQKEAVKLQNELKVRTKLNQLQSAKMQELSKSVSKADQDIHECNSQIDDLRLQLLEMNGT